MEIILNPSQPQWKALCTRAVADDAVIEERVRTILSRVEAGGDAALVDITREVEGRTPVATREGQICDGEHRPGIKAKQSEVCLEQAEGERVNPFLVTREQIEAASAQVDASLKAAIAQAAANIRAFHSAQMPQKVEVETVAGVRCVRRSRPIDRVGLYIPGGSAPLFSTLLMLAVPARIAGCREIVLCTPAGRDGKIAPAVLYAADFCGVDTIYSLGGAQAIAAMAFGTGTIAPVSKIFGPGNRYVTKAKQLVSARGVAIDMPAGPSEVMVLADDSADARFVAADLLSQAEHGPDSQAMLVCGSRQFAEATAAEVERQLALLPRRDIASKALENSRIVVFTDDMSTPTAPAGVAQNASAGTSPSVPAGVAATAPGRVISSAVEKSISFANAYAAEHLIISMRDPWAVAERITAAGSVFIGNYSPESAGDYASGTNHTLPTMGLSRAFSGIGLDSFMHSITYQELTREGLESLGDTIIRMASAEGLDAHAAAVKIRLDK